MTTAASQHQDNIVIGSGRLFLDVLDADDATQGERYLGDAVSAALTITSERAQVFSGSGPVARQLVNKVRSLTRGMTVTLHDMSMENLALFTAADEPESAGLAEDAGSPWSLAAVKKGRWYQIGASASDPIGVPKLTAVSEVGVAADTDKYSSGETDIYDTDDYAIDRDTGRIVVKPGGSVAEADGIRVAYTSPATTGRRKAEATELREVRAAVRYLEDTQTGEGRNFYAPLCSVSAGGEMALMSRETEQQIQLGVEILDPGGGRAALTIDGRDAS